MGKTRDLGLRIELASMDKHCCDISIGLYQQSDATGSRYLVHTYSKAPGSEERIAFIQSALETKVGLSAESGSLAFTCGTIHLRALKRAFLDLCRMASDEVLEPCPMTVFDKKAAGHLSIRPLGDGVYEIVSEDGSETGNKRAAATAKGFAKLCEMAQTEDLPTRITFNCGHDHHELMSMLMFRAQNVRAAMQEDEMSASRGTLAAPSQQ